MSLVATLQTLIRAASALDGMGPLRAAEAMLREAGLDLRVEGTHPYLVAARPGARLLLSGHVDVVAPGDGWTHAPFGGDLAQGRVWGRGACDMLGSVACFIELARRRPDLPLAVSLTTDEETGMEGARELVAAGRMAPFEACIVGEPTDFEVGVAEKGVLWLRAVAEGRAAHSSMPDKGDNAILKLMRALPALSTPPFSGTHPMLGQATASLNLVSGGTQVNIVPERAQAEIDHRYLPPHHEQDMLEALRAQAPDVRIEVLSSHPPFAARAGSPLVARAVEAVAAEAGDAREVGLPYGTEASRFIETSMDLVILGPGERALAHTNRESIRVEDLERGLRVYERIADAYARE